MTTETSVHFTQLPYHKENSEKACTEPQISPPLIWPTCASILLFYNSQFTSVRWCKPKEIIFVCRPLFKIVAGMHYSDGNSANEPAKLLCLFPGGEVISAGRCFGCSLLSPALGHRWLNFYTFFSSICLQILKYKVHKCTLSSKRRSREGSIFKATLHEKHPCTAAFFYSVTKSSELRTEAAF